MDFIFIIVILIFSVILHEIAHGYTALYLGDQTARFAGRLTLNPLKHLDPVGSVLVPLGLYFLSSGLIFGWAKPVPYNPYNLRNQKWGEAFVAAAGPLTNLLIALVFGLIIRIGLQLDLISSAFVEISSIIVLINIVLAIFNLVPIPPLDGSKILFSILPYRYQNIRTFLEKYGFIILLIFIFFLWDFVSPIILWLFSLIVGGGFAL